MENESQLQEIMGKLSKAAELLWESYYPQYTYEVKHLIGESRKNIRAIMAEADRIDKEDKARKSGVRSARVGVKPLHRKVEK